MTLTSRETDFDLLDPAVRPQFDLLRLRLANGWLQGLTHTDFRVFETYRSPERQDYLIETQTTKAVGWLSMHQYGLAVDFVPYKPGVGWTWAMDEDWPFLHVEAKACGLSAPISWDLGHIEHPKRCDRLRAQWRATGFTAWARRTGATLEG